MVKLYQLVFYCMFSFMCLSCSQEQGLIEDLEDLATSLKEESSSYSDEDWEAAAEDFQRIEDEMSQYNYSRGDIRKIGRLEGICLSYFAKKGLSDIKEMSKDAASRLEGLSEGFAESFFNNEE